MNQLNVTPILYFAKENKQMSSSHADPRHSDGLINFSCCFPKFQLALEITELELSL